MTPLLSRSFRAVLALVCAFAIAPLGRAEDADSTEPGWHDLLAVDALADGWKGYKTDATPAAWSLKDGVLTGNGTGGDLVTREEYGDFDLEFEFNVAPGGNSGVIYLASEAGQYAYETGPEFQVLDPKYPGVNEKNGPGALYDLYPVPLTISKPAGEWNTGRIVIKDGNVQHWLNGQKVVDAQIGSDDWNQRVAASKFNAWKGFGKNKSGFIALQDHGSPVTYRNVRIKRLDGDSKVSENDSAKRVLFVTQSQGFVHSTVNRKPHELSHAEQVLTELGLRSGDFRVDCTQDVANDFTPELLKNYDVVAFYTTGDLPIPEATREWFLNTWLAEEGHGFLGVHSAADTYHNYEPFWDMIGGTFVEHPWTADTDVVIKVHADDHPASKPWGAAGTRIPLKEEIYMFKHWQPEKVRVLMSLDMEKTALKRPVHIPILWVKNYGKGRVMHMSMGHREDVWTNPQYQESLIGGVRWLLGKEKGDATPNPELSAAEQKLAEAAAK